MASSRNVVERLSTAVPPALADRVEEWERTGRTVVAPRPSASVVLLRQGEPGLETYLLHRHERMAFAPSMVVFPGGGVDPVDGRDGLAAVLRCALRETAEETGVQLRADDLRLWAHWTTPVFERRRYDTWFFLAALPASQVARDLSGETATVRWSRPGDALAAADAGTLALMPPTRSILLELEELGSVSAALSASDGRRVEAVAPTVRRTPSGWVFDFLASGAAQ